MAATSKTGTLEVLEEGGLRKSIGGFTWPGIEYGEPPSCAYTFFEYVDALRLGDLQRFRQLEPACEGWYSAGLDRGAGAALHFAVDHGRLEAVKFLIEQRGAEVNQQDCGRGWTPLMRCARMAHYKHAPFLQMFEYLLQQGADPAIKSFPAPAPDIAAAAAAASASATAAGAAAQLLAPPLLGRQQPGQRLSVLDVAADKGFGWEHGAVRAELQRLIEQYAAGPKKPAHLYRGPPLGETALRLQAAWEALPKLYPPPNWRPPPPAGYLDARGARRATQEAWRQAGERDGSAFQRPMTDGELQAQAANC